MGRSGNRWASQHRSVTPSRCPGCRRPGQPVRRRAGARSNAGDRARASASAATFRALTNRPEIPRLRDALEAARPTDLDPARYTGHDSRHTPGSSRFRRRVRPSLQASSTGATDGRHLTGVEPLEGGKAPPSSVSPHPGASADELHRHVEASRERCREATSRLEPARGGLLLSESATRCTRPSRW